MGWLDILPRSIPAPDPGNAGRPSGTLGPMQPRGAASAIVRTIAGPWGPLHLAATTRGIVAVESATTDDAFMSAVARRAARAGRARNGMSRPTIRGGSTWTAPRRSSPISSRAGRRGAPCHRSTSRTGRTGTVASSARSGRSRGARPPATARSPVGSGRRGQPGRSAARSAATRSACWCRATGSSRRDGTIGGYGGDAWGSREAALERKRALLRREGITVGVRDAGASD